MEYNVNEIYNKNRAYAERQSKNPLDGIYMGIIRGTTDETRSGYYDVEIPALTTDPTRNVTYPCMFSSPFAGITNAEDLGTDIKKYTDTQKSYGMWMTPPDVGNLVLVAFADGNSKLGVIISCLFGERLTHMVPGMASGKTYGDPGLQMPAAEKNKRDAKPTHNDAVRPLHVDFAENIVKQGLINDSRRGVGSSGSRRESPSEVFGILTPGPRDPDNNANRLAGHQFIMDDSLNNRMMRLRTAGGQQILMDDNQGCIYIINKKGTAWFEMNTNGDIYMHSEGTIAMRAKGNFDLRADKDVNIEAGGDVHIKAAGDNLGGDYVGIPDIGAIGIPPLGYGGNIRFDATGDLTQYAGLNAQLTANGGDIDFSAGSRFAATAGGPLGMDFQAATGGIRLQSTQPTSIMSSAFSVSAGLTAITSAQVLINSAGPPALPAVPAVPAPQIGVSSQKDAPANAPEFDKDAALSGGTAAPTAGERTGKQDNIKTIVSKLITAEPFKGHDQYDPIEATALSKVEPNQDIIDALPPGAIDQSGKPADVNVPGVGFLKGTGYTDTSGNPLTNVSSAITDGTNAFSETIGGIGDTVSGIAGNLTDALPDFSAFGDSLSQFTALQNLDFTSLNGVKSALGMLGIAIPPIRFPTSNALAQKVIGIGKKLKELEATAKQFALDALNLNVDLNLGAIKDMSSKIAGAVATVGGGLALVDELKNNGIEMIRDGAGAIFQDALGNKLVDFSNGIGPIGAQLGLAGDLNTTFNNIKDKIDIPLTQNETVAITHFANNIGEEAFSSSNVRGALNNLRDVDPVKEPERYALGKANVMRLMKGWTLGSTYESEESVAQPHLQGMREWEISLFQTPDEVDIDVASPNGLPGSETYSTLANKINARRAEYFTIKKSS